MLCKNMKKNKTLYKKEFIPSKAKTAINECGIMMYLTRISRAKEKKVAIIAVIRHIFLLLKIW